MYANFSMYANFLQFIVSLYAKKIAIVRQDTEMYAGLIRQSGVFYMKCTMAQESRTFRPRNKNILLYHCNNATSANHFL